MPHPLMPKATAVWLVEHTALSFEQIADYCGLHQLEVQAIADGEVAAGMQGLDPITAGELTQEEIDRCLGDPAARMKMAKPNIPQPKARAKGARYTPVSKRQDRPDAIAWLLRNHPELADAQISKLIGTTKPTINAIRERTHWNMTNIKPQNPVGLGLCSAPDLDKAVAVARKRARNKEIREAKAKAKAEKLAAEAAAAAAAAGADAGTAAPETPAPGMPPAAPTEPGTPTPESPALSQPPPQSPTPVAPAADTSPPDAPPPDTPEILKTSEAVFEQPAAPQPPEPEVPAAQPLPEGAPESTAPPQPAPEPAPEPPQTQSPPPAQPSPEPQPASTPSEEPKPS